MDRESGECVVGVSLCYAQCYDSRSGVCVVVSLSLSLSLVCHYSSSTLLPTLPSDLITPLPLSFLHYHSPYLRFCPLFPYKLNRSCCDQPPVLQLSPSLHNFSSQLHLGCHTYLITSLNKKDLRLLGSLVIVTKL